MLQLQIWTESLEMPREASEMDTRFKTGMSKVFIRQVHWNHN